jgi:hypothetical protein
MSRRGASFEVAIASAPLGAWRRSPPTNLARATSTGRPGTVTGSDGNLQTIQQFTLLRVLGMGLSAGPLSDLKLFELSVNEP